MADTRPWPRCPPTSSANLDETDRTWEWAWANPANTNPRMIRGGNQLRRLAENTPGAPEYLTHAAEFPVPFQEFGTAMAILCAGVSRGFCFFACPYVGGEEFVVIDRFPAAAALTAAGDGVCAAAGCSGSGV